MTSYQGSTDEQLGIPSFPSHAQGILLAINLLFYIAEYDVKLKANHRRIFNAPENIVVDSQADRMQQP